MAGKPETSQQSILNVDKDLLMKLFAFYLSYENKLPCNKKLQNLNIIYLVVKYHWLSVSVKLSV